MYILDELCDLYGSAEILQCDRVSCETGEFVCQGDEGKEVFFDCDVEGVAVFEVRRDCSEC